MTPSDPLRSALEQIVRAAESGIGDGKSDAYREATCLDIKHTAEHALAATPPAVPADRHQLIADDQLHKCECGDWHPGWFYRSGMIQGSASEDET